ncbi:MAG: PH domain-containing protein [Candidatus Bathyarchaeia archaeon]
MISWLAETRQGNLGARIRLFGATGYGGYYSFPNIGKTFVIITNSRDGVLIKTKQGNFFITPKNREGFIGSIRRMAKPEKVGS